MRKIILIALALAAATPAIASDRSGARLNAIASGRLYDRILTPQFNPSYTLDAQAEQQLFDDVRAGRTSLNAIPEQQRHYFQMQMELGR